jgi:cytochrome c biogenesis protein CcmG/thiol:disulfide interchange protein DsbE
MKIDFLFLTILSVLTFAVTFGQTKYIKTNEGEILDTITYAKLKAAQVDKLKSLFPAKDIKINIKDNFKEIKKTEDSLIYSYKWDIKIGDPKVKDSKSFEPEDYIDKEFPLPIFKTLDNKKIGINDLKGKPTLINF